MADSEEFRLKRLMHEQQQSRVFDQVMGLGDFADSSQGSNTSSKSPAMEETKAMDEVSGIDEHQHPDEDNSNSSSRQDEKMDEGAEESLSPRIASPVTEQCSSFTVGPSEGGGRGEAAFDDALDGLPSFGPEEEEEEEEEEDEDWHFALPAETLQDDDCVKAKCKNNQSREQQSKIQDRPREDLDEEQEREATSGSANTSHSSKDNTPESSQDATIVNQMEKTQDRRQGERFAHPPVEARNPPMSPNITIKDEPVDEGYNAAVLPQSTVRHVKEELDHQEEELRISSVYSVGGGNTLVPPVAHQVTAPAPPQTTLFIPGRGAVLQAVTPLSVRPPTAIQTSLSSLSPISLRPPVPTIPGSVRCSGCFKVLLKGQTAFQRKGSTQLFCSTICLTGHLPATSKNQLCSLCNCEILRVRDTITIPADDNTYLHFCGQHCLSIFRHRTKKTEKAPEKVVEKRPEKKIDKPQEKSENVLCSVCRIPNRIEHEVSHQGRLHKLCSDACFVTWRKMRQLAMNCCEGCGLYCNSRSDSYHTLTIEKSELNFCGPTCIGTYKQSCRKTIECARCQKSATVSVTIMERDDRGKVQLYCSPICVQMSRPQLHTLTGAPFPCCLCKNVAVPQYHLAMVDGTIRNFCSYECVSTFRRAGHTGSDLINGKSSPRDATRLGSSSGASSVPPIPQDYPSPAPYPSHHGSNSSVPPLVPPSLGLTSSAPGQGHPRTPAAHSLKAAEGGASDTPKVTCHQCTKQFTTKPLLFGHQDQISVFCSMICCDAYKTQNNILVMCEVCRRDKVPFDTMHYNGKDIFFCSKHCKQNFKMCITARNKDPPCRPCSYCYGISQKMLHSHYGGKLEEFCKPLCMSQYTVLYYGMGRCDSCQKQGYLNEKLQYIGSVRNFCNLTCLLQYCFLNFQSTQHTTSNGTGPEPPHAPAQPQHSSIANPIIADVVSLANGSATQPSVPASDVALTGGFPTSGVDGKSLGHASTQTDTTHGPPSHRRQMKNKSVLCRPFTMDQESLCLLLQPSTDSSDDITSNECGNAVKKMKKDQEIAPSPPSSNCSTEEDKVKMLMVPVPVPVFIPVPMNMYSQHTPVPMPLPITIPVPIVMPPQSKEVTDAAIQSNPWNEDEKQDHVEVSMEQEVVFPVVVPPLSKAMKDAAVQSDPLKRQTEEQNQAQMASQIKDVKDVAVQSEPMLVAQVPLPVVLPLSKDVQDAAVQSKLFNLKKQNDLEHSKEDQIPSKVPAPIFAPPLSKHAITDDVQSDRVDVETAAAAVRSDSSDVETAAAAVRSDSSDVETAAAAVRSDSSDVETAAAAVQSNPLDVEKAQTVQSDHLTVETAATVQSNPFDVETAAPVQSDPSDAEGGTKMDLGGATSEVVAAPVQQLEESPNTAQSNISPPSASTTEPIRTLRKGRPKSKATTCEQQESDTAEQQPPSSPMTDLEFDFPAETYDQKSSTPQRGVKRPREGYTGRKRGRRRTTPLDGSAVAAPVNFNLNYMYGVKAWRSWVLQHNTHSRRSNPVIVKEDILQCDSAELSYALSCFIKEVRRPNGEFYSPDSIFYLCLGIQQYLFIKGRIENIFTDELYSQFALEISGMLRLWKPKQLPNGSPVSSRVEESFLWECKQLGAYSPIVLLNTLLFFYTKNFHFTTLAQHQSLSFSNFSLHTKPCSRAGKVLYLKYRRSGAVAAAATATSSRAETAERMKKRQEKEDGDIEMVENVTNPLHCPVRLYEFYLSRCPPAALKRTDMFYLQPERNVHTHRSETATSSYWYTSHALHHTILQSMLTRILAVKEVQR
ncbi:zinc finger MYM-type protein 4-like isoform X3 [Syngnathus acus]|uniref:zinc finger MYM-type protein 4-like isoform X3 n=1 Tax=Syngnathus acus TaxID=161584 RepID=UPI001886070D|nr:zinc finger MYM-type protein 4-like isoform X3 [Syngnathus acus]